MNLVRQGLTKGLQKVQGDTKPPEEIYLHPTVKTWYDDYGGRAMISKSAYRRDAGRILCPRYSDSKQQNLWIVALWRRLSLAAHQRGIVGVLDPDGCIPAKAEVPVDTIDESSASLHYTELKHNFKKKCDFLSEVGWVEVDKKWHVKVNQPPVIVSGMKDWTTKACLPDHLTWEPEENGEDIENKRVIRDMEDSPEDTSVAGSQVQDQDYDLWTDVLDNASRGESAENGRPLMKKQDDRIDG